MKKIKRSLNIFLIFLKNQKNNGENNTDKKNSITFNKVSKFLKKSEINNNDDYYTLLKLKKIIYEKRKKII